MRDIFCKEMQPLVDKLKTQRGQLQIIVDKAKVGQFDPYNSTTNQYSNQGIVQFIDGFKLVRLARTWSMWHQGLKR